MADLIQSAGLQSALAEAKPSESASPRRAAVQLIRATLRKADASDDELDDALEALIELSKE